MNNTYLVVFGASRRLFNGLEPAQAHLNRLEILTGRKGKIIKVHW